MDKRGKTDISYFSVVPELSIQLCLVILLKSINYLKGLLWLFNSDKKWITKGQNVTSTLWFWAQLPTPAEHIPLNYAAEAGSCWQGFYFSASTQRHFVLGWQVQSTFLPIVWSVRPGFLHKSICISSSFSESLARGTVPRRWPRWPALWSTCCPRYSSHNKYSWR